MKNLKEMTDEQLAIAYIEGNNRAFDLLLARNQAKLYSYIMFIVRDRTIADDIFQDTFVKVITKLRQGAYKTNGKFSAWITRIAHNIIIDMFRDQKIGKIIESTPDNDLSNLTGNELADANIETRFVKEQNMREAKLLMESLPAIQREIVYMRFYQQMSFKEIAETTGISINTALGRMRYAVLNMRKKASEFNVAI
ncbi:MAG: RNA polymerase sigma factor [Prevotella sp.]